MDRRFHKLNSILPGNAVGADGYIPVEYPNTNPVAAGVKPPPAIQNQPAVEVEQSYRREQEVDAKYFPKIGRI